MTTMITNPAGPTRNSDRGDNLLGVCHAIGESFGFNPMYLRLAFVGALLADFEMTLIAYAAGAVAVVVARR